MTTLIEKSAESLLLASHWVANREAARAVSVRNAEIRNGAFAAVAVATSNGLPALRLFQ